jgi:CRP-like cAMP-binding protein
MSSRAVHPRLDRATAADALARAFGALTAAQRERLQVHARLCETQAGDVILAEGARADALYVVVRGVAVATKDSFGVAISVDELRPGALFGEVAFVGGSVADVSVIAREPLELLVIEHFDAALRSDPALAAGFYRSLAAVLADRLRLALDDRANLGGLWG